MKSRYLGQIKIKADNKEFAQDIKFINAGLFQNGKEDSTFVDKDGFLYATVCSKIDDDNYLVEYYFGFSWGADGELANCLQPGDDNYKSCK